MTDSWKSLDGEGYDPAIESFLLNHDFEDTSWHNDMTPSFTRSLKNAENSFRLCIDYADPARREVAEARFELQLYTEGEFVGTIGSSESWPAMREAIEGLTELSQYRVRQILGEPVERTDLDSEEVQDIIGFGPEDEEMVIGNARVASVLIYHGGLYILKLTDGTHWTMIIRDEYHGSLGECEIPLAEFAESEGYVA